MKEYIKGFVITMLFVFAANILAELIPSYRNTIFFWLGQVSILVVLATSKSFLDIQ